MNPTARHFSAAYKKLLVHYQVRTSARNVEAMDKTDILFTTRTTIKRYCNTTPNSDDTLYMANQLYLATCLLK